MTMTETIDRRPRWRHMIADAQTSYGWVSAVLDELDAATARAEASAREVALYRTAFQEIRDTCGHVCPEFELCTHPSCRDSHAAWEIADSVLAGRYAARAEASVREVAEFRGVLADMMNRAYEDHQQWKDVPLLERFHIGRIAALGDVAAALSAGSGAGENGDTP